MENKEAIKLIDKILKDLDKTGIETETLVDDIKVLRAYALEEQIPLVVKALRLIYEHIETYNAFLIPVLDDEPVGDEVNTEENDAASPVESLKYALSLIKNLDNKINVSDLKEYVALLMAF